MDAAWVALGIGAVNALLTLVGHSLTHRELVSKADLWRREQRGTKEAEVAGHVIGASRRMLDALAGLTAPSLWYTSPPDSPKSDRDALRLKLEHEVTERWKGAAETLREFREAVDLAHTFLPEDAAQTVESIDRLIIEVQTNQRMWLLPQIYGQPGSEPFFRNGFVVRDSIADRRVALMTVLKPIARHEESRAFVPPKLPIRDTTPILARRPPLEAQTAARVAKDEQAAPNGGAPADPDAKP